MAFIEPMHRNKPNITYLLTEMLRLVFLSVLQGCVFIMPFYYAALILSCCEILF